MKYCITIEQLSGSQKSHSVHYFRDLPTAHTSFMERCAELSYDHIEVNQDDVISIAGGRGHDYLIELRSCAYLHLTDEF